MWSYEIQCRYKKTLIDYDANGNQLAVKQVIFEGEQPDAIEGVIEPVITTMHKNLWDEEDRLRAVDLNPEERNPHPLAVYTYDAAGMRAVRYVPGRIDAWSNGLNVSSNERDEVMLYPSPMVTAKALSKPGETPVAASLVSNYTKHYYIGTERVSSRIGTAKDLGLLLTKAGDMFPGIHPLATTSVALANTGLLNTYNALGQNISLSSAQDETIRSFTIDPDPNKFDAYWYHSDHLGSSSYISNRFGKVTQHMEYLPFGETLVDEHLNSYNSPFKFNGKELDDETGNYYYGARYYNPKWSVWLSVDPLANKYPQWSSYNYTLNNPINMIDPDGRSPFDWIYDLKKKEYVWDGNVNSPCDTPEGFEYVGKSTEDVTKHYNKNIRTTSREAFFGEPEFGKDRTPWPGEISERKPTVFESARDFGIENNVPFTETAYDVADDVSIFVTSFDLLNPKGHPISLDGTNPVRGSEEHIDAGVNGYMTVLPLPKFNIKGFDMIKSNKFFKGTKYNQLAPKVKGKILSTFNSIMKVVVTPKSIIKQVKSKSE